MNQRDRGTLILIWVIAACILALIVLYVSKADAQCCPPGGCAIGIPGPYGGGVGVRAGGGRGIQAGVLGPYGGVVGAQVGGGRGVAVGVLPGPGRQAPVNHCPAVVRIQSDTGNSVKHGTGTLIILGGRWHVLTAAHILAAGADPRVEVGGRWVQCRIVATDALRDVALLARANGEAISAPAMELSAIVPASAAWQGFGHAGFAGGNGPVRIDGEMISVPGRAPEGTSGGPIYCQDGLVSVITEANNGPGYWVTAGPKPEWLAQWVHAAYATDQGNGISPDGVAGPAGPPPVPVPDDDYPMIRPVVQITRAEFDQHSESIDRLTIYVNGQTELNQEIQNQLMNHSAAIAELKLAIDNGAVGPVGPQGPPGMDADPARLQAIEDRLGKLEQAKPLPIGFVDRYMRPDPNGEHVYMGRRYSLREEQTETIALGQSRVTYYYPLEQSGGGVAAAQP